MNLVKSFGVHCFKVVIFIAVVPIFLVVVGTVNDAIDYREEGYHEDDDDAGTGNPDDRMY